MANVPGKDTFAELLEEGEYYENLFVHTLISHFGDRITKIDAPSVANRKFWDIETTIHGRDNTWEVKGQPRAIKNFSFETVDLITGKPHGIKITKADWFVIYHNGTFYCWQTSKLKDRLRELIRAKKFGKTKGGDHDRFEIYYFEMMHLKPFADLKYHEAK